MSRTKYRLAIVALTCCFFGANALAQTFPTRTITIIVPYPPGGPTDVAARVVAPPMAAALGQNIVVENISGGGTTIATARVARGAPDGHTLLLHNVNIASSVTLYPKAPFEAEKDLTGVGLVNVSPFVLITRKDLPANSMAELAAWMRQNAPQIRFAHVGAGSLPHLGAALLAKAVGVEVNMIPYRGATPALTDMVAGHADLYFATPISAGELIKTGAVKAFAVTSKEKAAVLPDVPSAVQLGYQDLDFNLWQGLFAPAAVPRPVLDRLTQALQLALADPKVRKNFDDAGANIFSKDEQTPEAANALLRSEIKRWGDIIRVNKIEVSQ